MIKALRCLLLCILSAGSPAFALDPSLVVAQGYGLYANLYIDDGDFDEATDRKLLIPSVDFLRDSTGAFDFAQVNPAIDRTAVLADNAAGLFRQAISIGPTDIRLMSALPGTLFGSAETSVPDFLAVLTRESPGGPSVEWLRFSAGRIGSLSSVAGGAPIAGTSLATLESFAISGAFFGGTTFALPAFYQPGPDSVLFDDAGLTITLNRSYPPLPGHHAGIGQTVPLIIAFDHFDLGGDRISGSLVLGASAAALFTAVPEPSAWALTILGFGLLGTSLRRQTRTSAPSSSRR